jgi:hypothetical protein
MHLNLLVDYLNAEWIVHRSALTDPSFNPVLAYFVHTALFQEVNWWVERNLSMNWTWEDSNLAAPSHSLKLVMIWSSASTSGALHLLKVVYTVFFAQPQELSVFSCQYCLGIVGRSACNPDPCSSLGCRFPPGYGNSSSYNCDSSNPLNLAGPPILRTYMFTPARDYFRVPHRQNLHKKASARRTQLVLKSPPDKVNYLEED